MNCLWLKPEVQLEMARLKPNVKESKFRFALAKKSSAKAFLVLTANLRLKAEATHLTANLRIKAGNSRLFCAFRNQRKFRCV